MPDGPEGDLAGPGSFMVDIVGESKYQDVLELIVGGKTEDGVNEIVDAVLWLEDNNPKDNQAVRVEIANDTVGYLDRENARKYRAELRKAGHPRLIGHCKAIIVGGWDRGNGDCGYFGVRLDLPIESQ